MEHHYRALDLPTSASKHEIRQKFRSLAKHCHPDHRPGDPEAEERFKRIAASYALLMANSESGVSPARDRVQSGTGSLIWLLWTFSPMRLLTQMWM